MNACLLQASVLNINNCVFFLVEPNSSHGDCRLSSTRFSCLNRNSRKSWNKAMTNSRRTKTKINEHFSSPFHRATAKKVQRAPPGISLNQLEQKIFFYRNFLMEKWESLLGLSINLCWPCFSFIQTCANT